MEIFLKNKKFYIIYLFFSCSLILEFFLSLDLLGGARSDFYTTFKLVHEIKSNFNIVNNNINHFPTHYLILALIDLFFNNENKTRLVYLFFSLTIPIIFYRCLILKYKNIDKINLFLAACIIFLLPAYRSSAIWANLHITAIFFYICALYFFLIYEKNNYKKKTHLILLITFLFLAIYTRLDFLFVYCAIVLVIFFKLSKKKKYFLISYSFFLTIPILIILFNYKHLLLAKTYNDRYALFSLNYFNSIVINASFIFLYIFPIAIRNILKIISINSFLKKKIISIILSILLCIIIFPYFNYNESYGGGAIFKISNMILGDKKILFFCVIISFYIIFYLSLFSCRNFIFFFLFFITYNSQYLMQKYIEPLLFILFYTMFNYENNFKLFDKKIIVLTYIFFTLYWFSALIYRYKFF